MYCNENKYQINLGKNITLIINKCFLDEFSCYLKFTYVHSKKCLINFTLIRTLPVLSK